MRLLVEYLRSDFHEKSENGIKPRVTRKMENKRLTGELLRGKIEESKEINWKTKGRI